MEKGWIKLFATTDFYKAEIIRQALTEQGINAVILNKRDSSYGLFGQVELFAHQDDQEEARRIIGEVNDADTDV